MAEAPSFCSQCGEALESGARFCDACGAPVEEAEVGPAATPAEPEAASVRAAPARPPERPVAPPPTPAIAPASASSTWRKYLLPVAVFAIVAIVGVSAFLVLAGGGGEDDDGDGDELTFDPARAEELAHAALLAPGDLPGSDWEVVGEDEFTDLIPWTDECRSLQASLDGGSIAGTEAGRAQRELVRPGADADLAVRSTVAIYPTTTGLDGAISGARSTAESSRFIECVEAALGAEAAEDGLALDAARSSARASAPRGGFGTGVELTLNDGATTRVVTLQEYRWRHGNAIIGIQAVGEDSDVTGALLSEAITGAEAAAKAASSLKPGTTAPRPSATAARPSTTATAVPATAAPTQTQQPTAEPTSTPSPEATPTLQLLPTPVMPGFPTMPLLDTSPHREVVDAVNRNGPAYALAFRLLDPAPLSTVFAGEALAKYTADLAATTTLHTNQLLAIELVSVDVRGTTAVVLTRERWQFTVSGSCSGFAYDETYELQQVGGAWYIVRNSFEQTGTFTCT